MKRHERAMGSILKRNEEALMCHERRYRATEGVIRGERGIMGLWRGAKRRQ